MLKAYRTEINPTYEQMQKINKTIKKRTALFIEEIRRLKDTQ